MHAPAGNGAPELDARPGWDLGGEPFSACPWSSRTKSLSAADLSLAPVVLTQVPQFRKFHILDGNSFDIVLRCSRQPPVNVDL